MHRLCHAPVIALTLGCGIASVAAESAIEAGPPLSLSGGYVYLGWWVDGAGDQNGDGFPDLLMSAPRKAEGFDTATGDVYLVYGGPSLPARASELDIGTPAFPGVKFRGRLSPPKPDAARDRRRRHGGLQQRR